MRRENASFQQFTPSQSSSQRGEKKDFCSPHRYESEDVGKHKLSVTPVRGSSNAAILFLHHLCHFHVDEAQEPYADAGSRREGS